MKQRDSLVFAAVSLALAAPVTAAELRRGGDTLGLALRTGGSVADTATFEGGADVTAVVGALQADFGASVTTGRSLLDPEGIGGIDLGPRSTWRGSEFSVQARWASDAVAIAVDAASRNREAASLTGALLTEPVAEQLVADAERSARISATLHPFRVVDLELGAQSSRTTAAAGTGDERIAGVERVFSTAKWYASPALTIEAGTAFARDSVAQAVGSTGLTTGERLSVQPRLVATIGDAATARWRFTAERVVVPVSPTVLTMLATASTANVPVGGEWRVAAGVERRLLDGVNVSTALTVADPTSATELGYASGVAVPTAVASGLRRQLDLGVKVDLARAGLAGATLTGNGILRASSVDDPLTGATRRASGERPYEGRLVFAQALPLDNTLWGLDTYITGPTQLYGVEDTTRVASAAGLGGFIDHDAGPLRLQFRIDNLVGGSSRSRTDYYLGDRGSGTLDRVERRTDNGRAVTLSLSSRI